MAWADARASIGEAVVRRLSDTQVTIGGRTVDCVRTRRPVMAAMMEGGGVRSRDLEITVLASDLPAPIVNRGAAAVIEGTTYRVRDSEAGTDTGLIRLQLETG